MQPKAWCVCVCVCAGAGAGEVRVFSHLGCRHPFLIHARTHSGPSLVARAESLPVLLAAQGRLGEVSCACRNLDHGQVQPGLLRFDISD